MANDLYDLLEVNRSASKEAITAGYQRLHAKFAGNLDSEDATNHLIALREAYAILSDSARRARYDEKLALREVGDPLPVPQTKSFYKLLLILAVVGVGAVLYSKFQLEREKARLEQERVAAEARSAELALQKQQEEKQVAEEAERRRLREEAIARANWERDLAYGNQISRNLQYAEMQTKRERQREQERESQQRVLAERQQQYEAERQLAKDKAYLRQLQVENAGVPRYWSLSR